MSDMTRTFKIALNICNRLWDFLPRELEGEAIKQIEQIAEESNAKED